jgi:hypothetical protein
MTSSLPRIGAPASPRRTLDDPLINRSPITSPPVAALPHRCSDPPNEKSASAARTPAIRPLLREISSDAVGSRAAGAARERCPALSLAHCPVSASAGGPGNRGQLRVERGERDGNELGRVERDPHVVESVPTSAQSASFLGVSVVLVPAQDANVDREHPDQRNRQHRRVAAVSSERECRGSARAGPRRRRSTPRSWRS